MAVILHYDCFAGISGDMNLAALIDLGVPVDYLREELKKLGVGGFEIVAEKAAKAGISGTRVTVNETEDHDHHHHHHGEHHHHEHRSFADIRDMISGSALSKKTKDRAVRVFRVLAEAEAQVHGKSVEDVHFHEVGAIDSIVDIVGAAICLEYLRVEEVTSGVVELGSGTVRCAHGVMPVPAPATALLARKFPSRIGGTDHEATTPTGAAYLGALAERFQPCILGHCRGVGMGIGHRDSRMLPNVLRVMLYETESVFTETAEIHHELSANIDDMTPEHIAYLTDKLFEAGADDVWTESIYMKKGRPGTKVCALADEANLSPVKEAFFRHSSTLGIRDNAIRKHILPRTFYEKSTRYGDVRIKHAILPDGSCREKVEFEDCRRVAEEQGKPVREITEELFHDKEEYDS